PWARLGEARPPPRRASHDSDRPASRDRHFVARCRGGRNVGSGIGAGILGARRAQPNALRPCRGGGGRDRPDRARDRRHHAVVRTIGTRAARNRTAMTHNLGDVFSVPAPKGAAQAKKTPAPAPAKAKIVVRDLVKSFATKKGKVDVLEGVNL